MTTFGIMTLNLKSENQYVREIAIRAKAEGFTCVRFVPSRIDPLSHLITGETFDYDSNKWVPSKFPIPNIIYDRCFYGEDNHSKQCMAIAHWLKKREDVVFLGYGLPNKLELYHALVNTPLSPYLPKTQKVTSAEDVINSLNREKEVILKPVTGSQGNGIFYLEKNKQTISVRTEKQKKQIEKAFSDRATLVSWLQQLLQKKPYLLQPYLPLTDLENYPFDLRVLLQKNEQGIWIEKGRGIRRGSKNGILSNLSAGGEVIKFEDFTNSFTKPLKAHIEQELKEILTNIPNLLEKSFMPLFELGIDIGIAKNGAIWILDINSKPGRKVVLTTNPMIHEDLYSAPLKYGKKALETDMKAGKSFYEKTLSY